MLGLRQLDDVLYTMTYHCTWNSLATGLYKDEVLLVQWVCNAIW